MNTEPAKIHNAMISVLRDVGAITKDKTNTSGATFKYRGIDQVYGALHPLFAKHGIYCRPEFISREQVERKSAKGNALFFVAIRMKYHMTAEDGSSVTLETVGEAMDSGDKGSNKGMAIAHKYALLQAFCVPTEETDDPDKESFEVAAKPELAPVPTEFLWDNEFVTKREEKPYKASDGSHKIAWKYTTASGKTCGTTNAEIDAIVESVLSEPGTPGNCVELKVKAIKGGKSFELLEINPVSDDIPT